MPLRQDSLRLLTAALVLAGCLIAFYLLFKPIQLRIWNRFGLIDLVLMVCLEVPFVLTPLYMRPRDRVTWIAWWIAAVLALDVVFFAIGELAPTGGHPSLEATGSILLGLAKPVVVPLAVVFLAAGCVRGERLAVTVMGFVCLMAETLFGVYL